MHKFVYSIFKTIAFAMIFVFVFDIVFYMYRVYSLNQRVESIMTSLQKVVMENNCLTPEDFALYDDIIGNMVANFNEDGALPMKQTSANTDANFIKQWKLNYGDSAKMRGASGKGIVDVSEVNKLTIEVNRETLDGVKKVDVVHTDMSKPGAYGDIQTVQFAVIVRQPKWGFNMDMGAARSGDTVDGGERGSTEWSKFETRPYEHVLFYTYYVPCLRYKSVTQ